MGTSALRYRMDRCKFCGVTARVLAVSTHLLLNIIHRRGGLAWPLMVADFCHNVTIVPQYRRHFVGAEVSCREF